MTSASPNKPWDIWLDADQDPIEAPTSRRMLEPEWSLDEIHAAQALWRTLRSRQGNGQLEQSSDKIGL